MKYQVQCVVSIMQSVEVEAESPAAAQAAVDFAQIVASRTSETVTVTRAEADA